MTYFKVGQLVGHDTWTTERLDFNEPGIVIEASIDLLERYLVYWCVSQQSKIEYYGTLVPFVTGK